MIVIFDSYVGSDKAPSRGFKINFKSIGTGENTIKILQLRINVLLCFLSYFVISRVRIYINTASTCKAMLMFNFMSDKFDNWGIEYPRKPLVHNQWHRSSCFKIHYQ